MRKIPCLFLRDFSERPPRLLPTVTPGCQWALAGEGVPTVKRDGTACLVRRGRLYRRFDAKIDPRTRYRKAPPRGVESFPCQEAPDPETGHWPHWVRVEGGRPEDRWHDEVLASARDLPDGTYELCGPAIGGNHERLARHALLRHGGEIAQITDRSWEGLCEFLSRVSVEGIVFHGGPAGAMCKIRRADFGIPWPDAEALGLAR